jgi:Mg2+ and Co2+ transporter CorA
MDRQLAELWRAGESDDVIAAAFGKTATSITSRANRMGLGVRDRSLKPRPAADGKPPWSAEEDTRIAELRRSGMSTRNIAMTLGRSINGIISRERKILDNARAAKKGRILRECMTTGCTTNFMSEGYGHRLCNRGNLEARYSRSQYE